LRQVREFLILTGYHEPLVILFDPLLLKQVRSLQESIKSPGFPVLTSWLIVRRVEELRAAGYERRVTKAPTLTKALKWVPKERFCNGFGLDLLDIAVRKEREFIDTCF